MKFSELIDKHIQTKIGQKKILNKSDLTEILELSEGLPSTFISYMLEVGPSQIGGLVSFFDPRSDWVASIETFKDLANDYKELEIINGEYEIHPAKNGLFPFAFTTDNDWLCWDRRNNGTETWDVVAVDCGGELSKISETTEQFLTAAIKGTLPFFQQRNYEGAKIFYG